MSNGTSWGLYIACFMFFVGLSAGGLIVASSASVFHIQKYKVVALPAVILSTCCICVAGILILVDLGGIQRFLNILGMAVNTAYSGVMSMEDTLKFAQTTFEKAFKPED